MKSKFLATDSSPEYYEFDGDIITAHTDGLSESFDLSALGAVDKLQGVEPDTLPLASPHIIRDAYRDDGGELHVTLCQAVGPGHWGESMEFDSAEYDPDAIHVEYLDKSHSGTPWALTRRGRVNPTTGETIDG